MATSSQSGMSLLETLLILFSIISLSFAQTFTGCDPTKKLCPPDPALSTNATFNFTQNVVSSKVWNMTAGPITYTDRGAEFQIKDEDMAPTVQSNFYIFFGRVQTIMQAADGKGIVSSVVLQSDDLDEIDWEFIGSNSSSAQSNYYGKGNHTSYDRVGFHDLDSPQTHYYNYSTLWTSEKIEWWINNKLVRTLKYEDALGGKNFPQTPCQVKLGAWIGGKKGSDKGRIDWAGGLADFSDGQTYTMVIKSLYVEDFGSGKEYTYGDRTGDWQSIKQVNGTSPIAEYIWKPHGVSGRWNSLPKAAQVAIICASIGVAGVLLAILTFCCIKQRRAGRKERAVADAEYEKGASELMEYRSRQVAINHVLNSTPSSYASTPAGEYAPSLGGKKGVSVSVMEAGRPMKSGWL